MTTLSCVNPRGTPQGGSALKKAVFIDIDHTLIRGTAINLLISYAFKRGIVPSSLLIRAFFWYLQYKFNIIKNFNHIIDKTDSLIGKVFSQMTADELLAVFAECFDQRIKPRIYPDSSTFLNSFRKEGFAIYFVSSTLEPLAKLLRDHYGFGEVIASKLEIKNKHFTGHIEGTICYGPEKCRQIKVVAKKDGISLADSFAFSDHISDMPMLEMVGHPVVINPSKALRKLAKAKKWEIRKLRLKPR